MNNIIPSIRYGLCKGWMNAFVVMRKAHGAGSGLFMS
jgi:hypothetical protein